MSLDSSLERMREDALEMGRCYFEGFAANLQNIISDGEIYLSTQDETYKTHSHELIASIQRHYENIPFDKLHGREAFYPLFVVRKLLPRLYELADEIFEEQKDGIAKFAEESHAILRVGNLYRESFNELLRKIRSHPEAKDFQVKIIDQKNRVWYW